MSDLPKELRIKAGMIKMGEPISWGSDTALMEQAADLIDKLQQERDVLAAYAERLRSALNPSIMEWLVCGMATNGRTKEEKPMAMLEELRAAITHEPTISLSEHDAEVAREAFITGYNIRFDVQHDKGGWTELREFIESKANEYAERVKRGEV